MRYVWDDINLIIISLIAFQMLRPLLDYIFLHYAMLIHIHYHYVKYEYLTNVSIWQMWFIFLSDTIYALLNFVFFHIVLMINDWYICSL